MQRREVRKNDSLLEGENADAMVVGVPPALNEAVV